MGNAHRVLSDSVGRQIRAGTRYVGARLGEDFAELCGQWGLEL